MRKKYPYIFDPKKRRIAKIYTRTKVMNGIANGIAMPMAFLLFVLYFGWSQYLLGIVEGELTVAFYAAALLALLSIVQLPMSFYSSYVYEHKHKLSRHSIKGWLRDYAKSKMLSYLFFVPAVVLVYYLMATHALWWLSAGILYMAFVAVLNYVSPIMILPLFYKLRPYKDRRHKEKIISICRKLGARGISNVLVANESSRSVKANALFTGFGRTKRIVLFDTLLDNFTKPEIETVIGHEVAHYLNKDVLKGFLLETIIIIPMLYTMDVMLRAFSSAFGIAPYSVSSLPLLMLGYIGIEFVLMPLMNYYSRHIEAKADLFALNNIRNPVAQISTERRLADNALLDHAPAQWIKYLVFSHPPAVERIKMAEDWMRMKK